MSYSMLRFPSSDLVARKDLGRFERHSVLFQSERPQSQSGIR